MRLKTEFYDEQDPKVWVDRYTMGCTIFYIYSLYLLGMGIWNKNLFLIIPGVLFSIVVTLPVLTYWLYKKQKRKLKLFGESH